MTDEEKKYLNTLTGRELFGIYMNKGGEYGDILLTAHLTIRDKLFPMLEECQRTGKKIGIREVAGYKGTIDPPLEVVIE